MTLPGCFRGECRSKGWSDVKSTSQRLLRALLLAGAALLSIGPSAYAGELRPLDLRMQRPNAAIETEVRVDPRIYADFADRVGGMTAAQRKDALERYGALRSAAAKRGTDEEIRHYRRLVEILESGGK